MRGGAVMVVTLAHAINFPFDVAHLGSQTRVAVAWVITVAARECVTLFILLSGYMLGRRWSHQGRAGILHATWDFLVRRGLRILPTYWVLLVVALVCVPIFGLNDPSGTPWDNSLPITWSQVLNDAFLTSDVANSTPVVAPMWTVPVEFHLYLLVPLIVLWGRWSPFLIGAIGTWGLAFFYPEHPGSVFVYAFTIAFCLGMRSRTIEGSGPKVVWRAVSPFVLVTPFVAIFAQLLHTQETLDQANFAFFDGLITTATLPLFLAMDLKRRQRPKQQADVPGDEPRPAPRQSWLSWVGTRSYSLYLVHFLVLEIIWRYAVEPLPIANPWWQALVIMAVGTAASLVVADQFYRWVEEPTERRSRRFTSGYAEGRA